MVIDTSAIVAMPTDEPDAERFEAAVEADPVRLMSAASYRKYGKGRHRAGLNYGDCFSYGLARISGQPLLFKGDDFGHTDIAGVAFPAR